MAGEWRTATGCESFSDEGMLLVEDGTIGEYRPRHRRVC